MSKKEDLFVLVVESKSFSKEEKEILATKIARDELTEEEVRKIVEKIIKEDEKDQKELERLDKKLLVLQRKKTKVDDFLDKSLTKLTHLFEKDRELKLKRLESSLDKSYHEKLEDFKKEDKELAKLYQKLIQKADEKELLKVEGKLQK